MDNPQATDFELGWLAGILDGEGWIGMTITGAATHFDATRCRTKSVKVEIKITNCDEAIILKSAVIMRKLGINPYLRTHKQFGENRRLVHEASTKHMATVKRLLDQVREHLIGNKRERAEIMLRFIALRQSNTGAPNPAYQAGVAKPGKHGPRTFYPYTAEELTLVEACRELQSRGASETTREDRDKAVSALRREFALLQDAIRDAAVPGKI